ncbi:hypothetical protein UFOVP760_276 [uncultured Caudovirales phage]|uniref:Uncharacterized protein n=1 Tax=uncultured Caudovirales phage TaxID=2100421 RepID=A0A6J7X9B6_9CAUD|nr:hypothetical protein UFOVP760_276 [uncultured Caudovirales phage]
MHLFIGESVSSTSTSTCSSTKRLTLEASFQFNHNNRMTTKATSPLLELTATSSYSTLQKATQAMCKHRSKEGNIGLAFSIFETNKEMDKGIDDSGDWIVDHPDIYSNDPVFEGNCIFFSDYWRIGEEKVYSDVMPNPRWEELISECNRQLIDDSDGSTACLFLEGFRELDSRGDGTRVFEIIWGRICPRNERVYQI